MRTWLVITHTDVTKAEVTFNMMEKITVAQLTILAQSFPKHVIDYMCGGLEEQVKTYGSLARSHEKATLLFMDIVGFTTMSKGVASADILNFLNKLFTLFDTLCDQHKSAQRVLDFAKDMLRISKMDGEYFKQPNHPTTQYKARRMESTANHGGIQISTDTYSLLQSAGNTDTWEPTGGIEVKGKGIMETFHIQMDEQVFDVKAIKRDLKDPIEKADDILENPRSTASSLLSSTAYRLLAASRTTRDTTANWNNLLFVGRPSDDKNFSSPHNRVSMLARERLLTRDDKGLPVVARRASQLAREGLPSCHENGFPLISRTLLSFTSLTRGTSTGSALRPSSFENYRPAGTRRASQVACSPLATPGV
eukprot:gene21200-28107_t